MENQILLITSDHLKKLRILAMNSLPNESCAILLGKKSANKNIVKDIVPLKNAARSNIELILILMNYFLHTTKQSP